MHLLISVAHPMWMSLPKMGDGEGEWSSGRANKALPVIVPGAFDGDGVRWQGPYLVQRKKSGTCGQETLLDIRLQGNLAN